MPSTHLNTYTLRPATSTDIPTLQTIESSAGQLFSSIPQLADLAGDHASASTLQSWLDSGKVIIASTSSPAGMGARESEVLDVGYVATHRLDASIYIAELSVVAAYQGKGVGSVLLDAVVGECADEKNIGAGDRGGGGGGGGGKTSVSLITYREVPWNAAWYARRGFREVEARELGDEHVAKMESEDERSLWREGYTRCCMVWEDAKSSAHSMPTS